MPERTRGVGVMMRVSSSERLARDAEALALGVVGEGELAELGEQLV
jgi:hypothetical protein